MSEMPSDTWYVAFIDVLGFSDRVEQDFDRLVEAFDLMVLEIAAHVDRYHHHVKMSVFSDAVVLRSPNLPDLLGAVHIVLWMSLMENLIVRGAISVGRHSEKESDGRLRVVSQALVFAAKLEHDRSMRFPCVRIDPRILLDERYWARSMPNEVRTVLHYEQMNIVNPCNPGWRNSAIGRVRMLRETYPAHAEKYDWLERLMLRIFDPLPMVPPEYLPW